MGKTSLFLSAVLITATAASAVGFGFGGCYLLGVPIGEAKVTEYSSDYIGITVDVDMSSGLPLKMGTTNFGVGTVVNFVPMFGMEAGFEMHMKYLNKAATISWTESYGGQSFSYSESIPEEVVKWKMNNIYAGARFNLPLHGVVRPYADGGFLLIMGKGIGVVDGTETRENVKGINMGVYFGIGTNIFVTRKFAINVPIKYNMPFAGTYKPYENGGLVQGIEYKFKPPAYFTVGAGVEVHVM